MSAFRETRRSLIEAFFQFLVLGRLVSSAGLAASFENDAPAARNPLASGKAHFRRYRVQATVSLFSVPVLRKDGVGAACLLVEEAPSGVDSTTAIQFAGGSWPDHIKGFNRFGMTQEVVREEDGAVRESGYLSFMTSSPEKNSDQAWRAFADHSRDLTLAVACGLASELSYRWALEHRSVPAGSTWMEGPRLMQKFRAQDVTWREGALPHDKDRIYPTFLHSVRKVLLSGANSRCTFIHNAKLYDLDTRFSAAGETVLLTGRIAERGHTKGEASDSEFRVWFDPVDPAGLPSKIEFRPRSFLHLTFQQDPAAGGPSFRRLIIEEDI